MASQLCLDRFYVFVLPFSELQSWKKNPYPVGFVGISTFPNNTGELKTDTE